MFDDSDSPRRILFAFDGRIGRRAWWLWAVLAMLGLGLYFKVVLRVAGLSAAHTDIALNLLLLWPAVAISVKRWHDRNKSAWWVLVMLIPVVGWLWVLIENGFLRGTRGVNRFGEEPAVNNGR
jgi:uncharacterized membrane protein YhaH (DUF805 family)